MKDITIIRIARITYKIEKDAKKELTLYMKKLSSKLDDSEVLRDIEIRITELLQQIGIGSGGVITASDVREVRTMLGEPKDFAEAVVQKKSNRILTWLRRIGAIILSLSALFMILSPVLYEVSLNNSLPSNKGIYVSVGADYMTSSPITVSMVVICFLSVVSLLAFIAYLLFKNKFNKKIFKKLGVALIALIILISITTWVAVDEKTRTYASYSHVASRSVSLPDGFAKISKLSLDTPVGVQIEYTASGEISMSLSHEQVVNPKVTISGDTATIYMPDEFFNNNGMPSAGPFVVSISGPALSSITSSRGYLVYVSAKQDSLSVRQNSLSHISVDKSYVKTINVDVQDQAVFSSYSSTVEKLNVSQKGETYVSAGNINSLNLLGQLACPADTLSRLFVDNITEDRFLYNGSYVSSKNIDSPCLEVRVGK